MTHNLTEYVVVTRKGKLPISRHQFVEDAADKIVGAKAYGTWEVLAHEGRTSQGTMRKLTRHERLKFEKRLWPTLFQ